MPFNLRGPEIIILLVLVAIIVGIIWFIVWLVRTLSRPKSLAAMAGPRPAGWYPVPDNSGRVAWWDGSKWDETVAPPDRNDGER